jgi:Cu(I)/Ag(I) efflux system membrane fusion protein
MSNSADPRRNQYLEKSPVPVAPDEGGLHAPPGLSPLRKAWWWFDFVVLVKLARLRFIAILLAIGGVIAYWDTIKAYYDKWTRPASMAAVAASDTEFWCPMHPSVVREKPDKCPVCGMPLSQRKKGDKSEDEPLPPGVVSRVQLSPYRVALAGIQTAPAEYRRLMKEIRTVGFVEFDERKLQRITARVSGKSRIDKLYVNVTGQWVKKGDPIADLYSPDLVGTLQNLLDARRINNQDLERIAKDRLRLWGFGEEEIEGFAKSGRAQTHVTVRSPISGHILKKYQVEGEYVEEGARLFDVIDLSTVWIEAQVYEDELAFLSENLDVTATTKSFPNQTFCGKIAFMHPHLDASTRTLRVRFDMDNHHHELRPGMYATVSLQSLTTSLDFIKRQRTEAWAEGVAAEGVVSALVGSPFGFATGSTSTVIAAMETAATSKGLILAVPESAVIDTGSRKVVYRESEPGVYDGVLVDVGPRSGGYYPIISGIEPGDRIAVTAGFLIDAETRLTGGVGSTYFGASGGPQSDKKGSAVRPSQTGDENAKVKAALAKLSPEDQKLAEAQQICPVLKSRLGSMGKPVKLMLQGEPVFLCCKACDKEAKEHPAETVEAVRRLRKGQSPSSTVPPSGKSDPKEAEIEASLSKLSPADRALAEAQRFCALQTKSRLGFMGPPVKIMIQGRPVFLCCDGCEDDAKENPAATLAIVDRLKASVKQGKGP